MKWQDELHEWLEEYTEHELGVHPAITVKCDTLEKVKGHISALEAKLEKEVEARKYLESFVKFCKCGNPEDDCICQT